MQKLIDLLNKLNDDEDPEFREQFLEHFISDLICGLEDLDPRDDGDEILKAFLSEDREDLLKTMLGHDDLDIYVEDLSAVVRMFDEEDDD